MSTHRPTVAPHQVCPDGTKLWLLNLGNLICDEGWILRAAGGATASNPKPESKFRTLVCISVLMEIPGEDGLVLFDVGCADDMDTSWGDVLQDIFAPEPKPHTQEFKLPEQIKKTGHDISEVKHIIIGHLHLDHAGGLDFFKGRTDVTVYVSEAELKHAWWAVATRADRGTYLPHYLNHELQWQTFCESELEIFPGVTLIFSPGHSPGLIIMMVHLKNEGTIIFTGDQYHIRENYEGTPQGWLMREYNSWYNSHMNIKRLVKKHHAKICFGHDWENFKTFKTAPDFHS